MRTTIIIDEPLVKKIKPLLSKRGVSRFVNQCIREHLAMEDSLKKEEKLALAYERAAKLGAKQAHDFESTDAEGWPEW